MRITQGQLRQIIKEELFREFFDDGDDGREDPPPEPDDQWKRMSKMNMKKVAYKMIFAYGAEDILGLIDIIKNQPQFADMTPEQGEDLENSFMMFQDLLQTAGTDLTMDPEDRRLTRREQQWFDMLMEEIQEQATELNNSPD